MMKLPRTSNGTILEPRENEILCSNPKGGKKAGSEVVAKDGEKLVQAGASVGNQSVGGWLSIDGNDPDDIAKYTGMVEFIQG